MSNNCLIKNIILLLTYYSLFNESFLLCIEYYMQAIYSKKKENIQEQNKNLNAP